MMNFTGGYNGYQYNPYLTPQQRINQFEAQYPQYSQNQQVQQPAGFKTIPVSNVDGTKGAKWTVADIVNKSGIDFEKKGYTERDYAYVVNMLYSDYGSKIKDPELLLDMAVMYLEDDDYPGYACERAYKNAKKRIHYFEEKRD